MGDEKTIEDAAEYVKDFLAQRFPEKISVEMKMIISEIVFDAFNDGMHWSEFKNLDKPKSKIITVS